MEVDPRSSSPFGILDPVARLTSSLVDVFEVESVTRLREGGVKFKGRFTVADTAAAFTTVRSRFKPLGHTPLFRWEGGQQTVIAMPGVIAPPPTNTNLNWILFGLTIVSVLYTSALYEAPSVCGKLAPEVENLYWWALVNLPRGLPFTLSLLTILGLHEMGHFLAARYHRVAVTPPYFVPLPVLLFTGTLGAVIMQKEPFPNRRVLFDIGVAGPLAGLVVMVPVLFFGLATSQVQPVPQDCPYVLEGNSLFYAGAKYLVFGQFLPSTTHDVFINSVASAGWAGLLVTAINLLPAGQLDGGHVAYVLFGTRTKQISVVIAMALGIAGVLGWTGIVPGMEPWLLWAALIYFLGRGHPPALDEITPLGRKRILMAWAMLGLFVLVFTPMPFREIRPKSEPGLGSRPPAIATEAPSIATPASQGSRVLTGNLSAETFSVTWRDSGPLGAAVADRRSRAGEFARG